MIIDVLSTKADNKSYFSQIEIQTPDKQPLGNYSIPFSSEHIQLREFEAGFVYPQHVAPREQYIVYLEGRVRVDASGGESKIFKAGDILLVKDTDGEGHISTTLEAGKAIIIATNTTFKIISGGQTGVDRAALDAAIQTNLPYFGWCPKGRIDENGIIPQHYIHLKEIAGEFKDERENYAARTVANIFDSDATLILVSDQPIKDGTALTLEMVKSSGRPYSVVNLTEPLQVNVLAIREWLEKNSIKTLNVAGPRESKSPGIHNEALKLLISVFGHV